MYQTEAIQAFLVEHAVKHLAKLYHPGMEVQVLVKEDGELVHGEYKGKRWKAWTDGQETWKPFRVPWRAYDVPRYEKTPLGWTFEKHVAAIGMTGWDWQAKVSRWVGFDVDALVNHASGLTDVELQEIRERLVEVPWLTVVRSTSGHGLHAYAFLEVPVETRNHVEHAALARSILALLEAYVGTELAAKIDACGHVLWCWHHRAASNGFELLKAGRPLKRVPPNWAEHEAVVQRKRTRTRPPKGVDPELFDEASSNVYRTALDEEHRRLLKWFHESKYAWAWDADRHLLTCHTSAIREVHRELELRGTFETVATGRDPHDQNCFAFPLAHGVWVVRRYGPGTHEAETWELDPGGWTRCYLNRPEGLAVAMARAGALETAKGGFAAKLQDLAKGLAPAGAPLEVPEVLAAREAEVRKEKGGRLVVRVPAADQDVAPGWHRAGSKWEKVLHLEAREEVQEQELIRHAVDDRRSAGWFIHVRRGWVLSSKDDARSLLRDRPGMNGQVEVSLSRALRESWALVNEPFEPEYPGGRRWNLFGAQLGATPREGDCPTWHRLYNHIGQEITLDVRRNEWCQAQGVEDGGAYLHLWLAAMLQRPTRPLPFLVIHGPQGAGKSTFHEALAMFFRGGRGYAKASAALESASDFNGELAGAVLCAVEEVNLRKAKKAYRRIKEWVTAEVLLIHAKRRTPIILPNTTHWIQTCEQADHSPVLPGDTRLVLIPIQRPLTEIPKPVLFETLRQELPAFLYELRNQELPAFEGRLQIPVLDSASKTAQTRDNAGALYRFLTDRCEYVAGHAVPFKDFYDLFVAYLKEDELEEETGWSRSRVGRNLPDVYPVGRMGHKNMHHVGNLFIRGSAKQPDPGPALVKNRAGTRLVVTC